MLKGVVIEESLQDKSVLNDLKIIKKQSEIVTSKHRTPWLSKWTVLTVEIPDEKMDEVCEKIKNCLDKEHDWYIELKSNRNEVMIFNGEVRKKRVFRVPE